LKEKSEHACAMAASAAPKVSSSIATTIIAAGEIERLECACIKAGERLHRLLLAVFASLPDMPRQLNVCI
jgi:hypothetical protein